MKVKVLKYFVDKKTKEMRKPNDVFEVTESRLKEIQAVGNLVEVIENSEPKTKAKKKAE